MTRITWTEDRIALLAGMWQAGSSAQLISDTIGCTRSAVIGKANRLGLEHGAHKQMAPLSERFETFLDYVVDSNHGIMVASNLANIHLKTAKAMWAGLCREMGVPVCVSGDKLLA